MMELYIEMLYYMSSLNFRYINCINFKLSVVPHQQPKTSVTWDQNTNGLNK